jgi:TonB family protein
VATKTCSQADRDQKILSPLGLSFGIHAFLALGLIWLAQNPKSIPIDLSKVSWVEVLPKSDPRLEDERSKRVVQTQTGKTVKEAPKDAYLGEKNQVVERETVSKNQRVQAGKTPSKTKALAPTQNAVRSSNPTESSADRSRSRGVLSQFGVPMFPNLGGNNQPRAPEPRRDDFEKTVGTGTPQDYIRGLKESESTALNTREFMFYSYFQRIRERLDYAWNKSLQDRLGRMFRSGRYLASDREHTTKVLVTLNGAGEITRVQVVEDSGTRDLDDAAVKSFNEAGPFPNPPRGMMSSTGTIQIRWDFVLRT